MDLDLGLVQIGVEVAGLEIGPFQDPWPSRGSYVRGRDLLGQEMGQGALQIPADLHVARSPEFGLKPSST